jgi:hypothetical protein
MQVSTYVKEAIEEVVLYVGLQHRPDVSESFPLLPSSPPAPSHAPSSPSPSPSLSTPLASFEASLDVTFFNVFNQPAGYYQLKRFAATCDEAVKLSFIEDATEYRMIEDGRRRLQR